MLSFRKIRKCKTVGEFDDKVIRDLEQSVRRYERRYLFWEVIRNLKALILFIAILPVVPIIAIIEAIKGEFNWRLD